MANKEKPKAKPKAVVKAKPKPKSKAKPKAVVKAKPKPKAKPKVGAKEKAKTTVKANEGTEVKRVIKRRRRKKGKGKQYFTQETENAIVEYNGTSDVRIRNNIYNDGIRYAFEKLAENILKTFKFSYFQCSHEEVQQEVVSNLVSNIHKLSLIHI